MITIRYFGFLKEALGISEEQIDAQYCKNTAELLDYLRNRNTQWADVLSDANIFKLVVNLNVIHDVTPIFSGDEVGILPPVTGG